MKNSTENSSQGDYHIIHKGRMYYVYDENLVKKVDFRIKEGLCSL